MRTLDVGADKPLAYVPQPEEPNPALGVRGLRLAHVHPELLDPWQPALLRLLAETARAGAAAKGKRPVGVCGEAASDPMLALVLVGLGITSLSMAPACLPDVRAALAERTLEECRALARAALEAPTAVTARATVAELARAQGALAGAVAGSQSA